MVLVLRDWRGVALRGVAALVFGVLTLIWPDLTVTVLVALYGAYALVDGVLLLIAALRGEHDVRMRRGLLGLQGLVSIGAGVITFVWPDITALALLYVIAFWAMLTGVMELAIAVRMRRELTREWLLGLIGIVSIAFSIMLVVTPGLGALVITWLIGWYGVLLGSLLLGLAWRLHQIETELENSRRHPIRPATA